MNFYRVNGRFWFVDLPGYGYAKVPEAVRRRWRPMIEGFLDRHGERIALAVVLVDARRGPTDLDRLMRDWLLDRRIPYLVTATKADKLSGNGRAEAARALRRAFGDDVILASAQTGAGTREIWGAIDEALEAAHLQGNAWTSAN